jgi:two-component system response regulator
LVEDNPDDLELTLRALKRNNFCQDIVVARDGREALDYLFGEGTYAERDTREMPAITLLDLQLPKINGLEVLPRVRSEPRTRRLPIVILTSSGERGDLIASCELGANSYIRKPVGFEQFKEVLCQLSVYWLRLNLSPPVAEAP